MQIIHVPHTTLRSQAIPITELTDDLNRFVTDLSDTLKQKRKPRGVGLSAPQVDVQKAVFVTYLSPTNDDNGEPLMRAFINPQIVLTSREKTLGEDLEKPILEGCLSIPNLYGPVPRYTWVELEYQVIKNDQLKTERERFHDFAARVIQHEHDHLQGKLFTDYILEFELPLYDDSSGKLKEIDRKIAEKF